MRLGAHCQDDWPRDNFANLGRLGFCHHHEGTRDEPMVSPSALSMQNAVPLQPTALVL